MLGLDADLLLADRFLALGVPLPPRNERCDSEDAMATLSKLRYRGSMLLRRGLGVPYRMHSRFLFLSLFYLARALSSFPVGTVALMLTRWATRRLLFYCVSYLSFFLIE